MNLKELEKAYAEGKHDVIANMTDEELMEHIMALANRYYVSYLNNDEAEHKSILKTLDLITDEYKSKVIFTDMDDADFNNYINYCMILTINSLLNDLIERNFNLKLPEAVAINTDMDAIERDKDIQDDISDFINRTIRAADCIKNLIRPSAKKEFIRDNMATLEAIFTDKSIAAINEYLTGSDGADSL